MRPGILARSVLAAAALACPFAAAAKSAPSIDDVTSSLALTYSPDADVSAAGSIRIRCGGWHDAFHVVFTQRSLTDSSGDPLTYGLYQTVSSSAYALRLDGSPTDATEVLSGAFSSSSADTDTVALPWSAVVRCAGIPSPDEYTAVLRAELYEGAFSAAGSGKSVAHADVRIRVTVGEHLDVSVVPAGGAFSLSSTSAALSFGAIAEDAVRGADLLVRSNIGYDLYLSSVHGGSLARTGDASSLIPYVLRSNGTAYALPAATPTAVASGAAATYGAGFRYAVTVTIPPFTLLPVTGEYSDLLTVTVSAP